MGGYDQAWDQAGQQANARLLQRRSQEEQQRQQKQNTVGVQLLDAINQSSSIKPQIKDPNTGELVDNPAYAQAQNDRRTLMSQYAALNSPEQHASFGQHLHGLIFGKPTPHAQQPLLSTNSSPVDVPAPPTGEGQIPLQPAQNLPLNPMAAAPANHPLHAITAGISALGNHLKAFANPLPPEQQPDTALMAKYYKDPAEATFERNKVLYGIKGDYSVEAAKARGANARPFHIGDANTSDAIAKLKLMPGIEYQDESGAPITEAMLAEAPPYMKLAEFRQGPLTFYKLIDQRSKETSIGGVKYQVNELGAIKPEASTALGNQNPDKDTMRQVPGMNPGEVINLHGTQAPIRTGMNEVPPSPVAPIDASAIPPSPAGEPQNPTLKTRPVATPVLPPSPSQKAVVDRANVGRSQSRQIPQPSGMPMPPAFAPGTMLAQGRSAQPVVSAMSVVGANIFGGNGEKPIWENAWMYDKPELRQALNNALTLNALKNPGTEENPGFMDSLRTALGATQWSQEQINQANVQARQELERLGGPEALKQFSREAAMQEDLPALRAATKASAAQGSLALAVRAAPVYNIASAQDFRNQLGTLLSTAVSGMRGYPAINPEYVKWWDRGVAAAKGGPVSSKAPGMHSFAIDDQGRKRPVTDPKAKLPNGWKWAD